MTVNASQVRNRQSTEGLLTLHARALSAVQAAIAVADGDGTVTFWNEAAEDITGWNAEEMVSASVNEIFHRLGADSFRQDSTARLRSAGLFDGEITAQRKDCSPLVLDVHMKQICGSNGEFLGIVCTFQDITARKRAEAVLRESYENKERLEALMDNNPSLVFLKDEAGRYVYLNKAYETRFVPSGDWYGKTDFDFWPEESAELFRANDASVLNSGQTMQFMEDSTDLNGQRYCWLNYKFPFTDSKNRKYLGGIGINATRLVQAEEALRDKTRLLEESNRQRTDILESISDCFYALDRDLRFTYVNKAAEEIWNLSRADLLGRKIEDVFEGLIEISLSRFHRVLAEQKPQHYEVFSKVALKWGDMSVYPAPDGISVYFHDITERKRAEEALRNSEDQLKQLSRILTAEVDVLRTFHQINTRYIRQDELKEIYKDILDAAIELTGGDCAALQLTADHSKCLKLIAHKGLSEAFARHFERISDDKAVSGKAMAERARVIVDDISIDPLFDGSDNRRILLNEGICRAQSTPLFSGSGNLVGMLTTHYKTAHELNERELRVLDLLARQVADVIEHVKMEAALQASEAQARLLAEALEKKNRLVTDFFINISHEFKTPLTILMLGLELLETKAKRMKEGEAFVGNLAAMKQNSYRLNRLVGNLLDITKLDAGFMQPKWEKADISGLLRNLAQSVEPYAWQRQLSLEYACDSAEIPFMTDGFMLERIVLNLLSNAIKHTPAGGSIQISCRAGKGGVSIAVKDTGEGIPADKKAMIFDRFSQVDTRMTRASEGTGIGLALAKSLAELLGGKITVESVLGKGSIFTVKLPYVKRAVSKVEAEQGIVHISKRVQMELSDVMQ